MARPNTPPGPEFSRSFDARWRKFALGRDVRLWVVALAAGVLVGLLMAGLRFAYVGLEYLAFGVGDERLASATGGLAPWRVVLVPVVGGALVALLLYIGTRLNGGRPYRMGGVQDVIYARRHVLGATHTGQSTDNMRLTIKDAILTGLMAIASLGTGASAGREGPAVHMGATFTGHIARKLNFDRRQIKALLGCGAGAAVAASFNAPIAGVLFAHEVVLGRYRTADIGPIAMASVTAALITQAFFGDTSVFIEPAIGVIGPLYFVLSPFMGLLAAAFAILVIRTWYIAPQIADRLAAACRLPIWCLPPFAGLVLGAFALAFPQVLGVGYEATASAIAGGYTPQFMLILCFAKLAATAICLGARFGGGVFSASIVTGAMLGGTFGGLAGLITGDAETALVFFTVVGMGAVSGAVLGAPISTTLIVFELTRSYETAAAVLVAVSLATVIVQALEGGSLFEKQLKS